MVDVAELLGKNRGYTRPTAGTRSYVMAVAAGGARPVAVDSMAAVVEAAAVAVVWVSELGKIVDIVVAVVVVVAVEVVVAAVVEVAAAAEAAVGYRAVEYGVGIG